MAKKKGSEAGLEESTHLNTRPVPITIVLLAAAVACGLSVYQGVDFSEFFFRLLKTVIIFALIGSIVKIGLDMEFNPLPKEIPPNPEDEAEGSSEDYDREGTEDIELTEEEEERNDEDSFESDSFSE